MVSNTAGPRTGTALRSAWVAYQRRIDAEMAAAGFDDREFPDGRVLRMCARAGELTISEIGRELEITRQGAGKIVAKLLDRRYVSVRASSTDGREKTVKLAPRAHEYLAAQRKATRTIERRLRRDLGADGLADLHRLLAVVAGDEDTRLRDYLRTKGVRRERL